MKYTHIPQEFDNLSWQELETLATYYNRLAKSIQRQASYKKTMSESNKAVIARIDAFSESYKTVIEYLKLGSDLSKAIRITALELDTKPETIYGWWKWFLKNKDNEIKEHRDRAIMYFVCIGFTNKEIAIRLGVHRNTVSKTKKSILNGDVKYSEYVNQKN